MTIKIEITANGDAKPNLTMETTTEWLETAIRAADAAMEVIVSDEKAVAAATGRLDSRGRPIAL